MPNIPIEKQILPADDLSYVQSSIEAGKLVCGDDLLLAIEQISGQPLSEVARDLVRRAVIPAVKSRGRPPKFGAPLDFALEKVDQRYPALLRYEKRKKDHLVKSGKGTLKGESPSMLAYARLLRHMKVDFGP
jgi:aminopeptidase N